MTKIAPICPRLKKRKNQTDSVPSTTVNYANDTHFFITTYFLTMMKSKFAFHWVLSSIDSQ